MVGMALLPPITVFKAVDDELRVAEVSACVERNLDCYWLRYEVNAWLLDVRMVRGNLRYPCFWKKDAYRAPVFACANQGVTRRIGDLRLQVVLDPATRRRDPSDCTIHFCLIGWGAEPARHVCQVVGWKSIWQKDRYCPVALGMQLYSEHSRTRLPCNVVIVFNCRPHPRHAPARHQNPALSRLERQIQ